MLKPVNSTSLAHKSTSNSPQSAVDSPESSHTSSTMSSNTATSNSASTSLGKRSRPRTQTAPDASSSAAASGSAQPAPAASTSKAKTAAPKRRRRAPSPSQWIPESLRGFRLVCDDTYRYTNVPLPPVQRNLPLEERDSRDENVGPSPYHPNHWNGRLPGPGIGVGFGLGGKDITNMDLGGRGGSMLGRVLVF